MSFRLFRMAIFAGKVTVSARTFKWPESVATMAPPVLFWSAA